MKTSVARLIFGQVNFPQSEEYAEFRYKFLMVLLLSGALFTALVIGGDYAQWNRIETFHVVSMHVFTVAALLLWWLLRGNKHRFHRVAWGYELVCMAEYTSALWFVPQDELRLLWFFTNVPGVFILLGPRAGWAMTGVTVVLLVASNALMPVAYSPNAMVTVILSLIYMGVFFHVYASRSVSYFLRMRDYNLQLERMAGQDMLTGVLNARAYYAACEQHISAASRTGQRYAVLFVDLDHFKAVNDTYGHAAGDAVLKAVAACLGQSIRKSDALGRIGGEEFSVFLPNTLQPGALQLGESMRAAIESLNPSIGSQNLRITASIGVAVCATPDEPMQAIQQRADKAMYTAKSLGRNRVSALELLI